MPTRYQVKIFSKAEYRNEASSTGLFDKESGGFNRTAMKSVANKERKNRKATNVNTNQKMEELARPLSLRMRECKLLDAPE